MPRQCSQFFGSNTYDDSDLTKAMVRKEKDQVRQIIKGCKILSSPTLSSNEHINYCNQQVIK